MSERAPGSTPRGLGWRRRRLSGSSVASSHQCTRVGAAGAADPPSCPPSPWSPALLAVGAPAARWRTRRYSGNASTGIPSSAAERGAPAPAPAPAPRPGRPVSERAPGGSARCASLTAGSHSAPGDPPSAVRPPPPAPPASSVAGARAGSAAADAAPAAAPEPDLRAAMRPLVPTGAAGSVVAPTAAPAAVAAAASSAAAAASPLDCHEASAPGSSTRMVSTTAEVAWLGAGAADEKHSSREATVPTLVAPSKCHGSTPCSWPRGRNATAQATTRSATGSNRTAWVPPQARSWVGWADAGRQGGRAREHGVARGGAPRQGAPWGSSRPRPQRWEPTQSAGARMPPATGIDGALPALAATPARGRWVLRRRLSPVLDRARLLPPLLQRRP